MFVNDFEWSQKGRCCVKLPPQRIYLEIWPEIAPLAVENFVALVLGNRGKGQESGCQLSYKGCHFHRVIKDFVAQGGDFVKNNGSGGECVFRECTLAPFPRTHWRRVIRARGWTATALPLLSCSVLPRVNSLLHRQRARRAGLRMTRQASR